MADVGDKVLYHSSNGDYVGFITDITVGRSGGDFRVAGFTNDAGEQSGAGPTFNRWSSPGNEKGQFSPA